MIGSRRVVPAMADVIQIWTSQFDSVRSKRYCQRVSADALIEEIGRRLDEATPPGSRVVLFGSRVRGKADAKSDVDVLVIEPSVTDSIQESVRLRRLLRGLGVPIDVLVVAQAEADRRSAVRGTLVERALREGRMLR
ncbi:MAG: nucleotidyltransferase domain-containing protein [Solirubrobacteraceae bacterium]